MALQGERSALLTMHFLILLCNWLDLYHKTTTESWFDPDPKQGSVPVRSLHPTDGIVRYSTGLIVCFSVLWIRIRMDRCWCFRLEPDPREQKMAKKIKKWRNEFLVIEALDPDSDHINVGPDPVPAFHFYADPGPASHQAPIRSIHGPSLLWFEPLKLLNFDLDAYPDPLFTLMRIRIQLPKIMRIRIRNPGQNSRKVPVTSPPTVHLSRYRYVTYSARFWNS